MKTRGLIAVILLCCAPARAASVLDPAAFKHHVDAFNAMETEDVVNHVPNSGAWQWMTNNVPLFECPDADFERTYYFRWWTFRKHIKQSPAGFVLTEFITPVRHEGVYGTISCAFGHHLREGRWLRDRRYLDEYTRFWFRGHEGGKPQPHLHKFSGWVASAAYDRFLVSGDDKLLAELLGDFVVDYKAWEAERRLPDGLFWQFDVRDGMEESISGSRTEKNARPTITSYMYANARAISAIAARVNRPELAREYVTKADELKKLSETLLWEDQAKFFKVRFENGTFSDAREAIGFIPWYFNLPNDDEKFASAWEQLTDPQGFWQPWGLTTAERRHPLFMAKVRGSCEWDGAVWPFATSQTLTALANLLNDYRHRGGMKLRVFFDAMMTYAKSHQKDGKPYIGEYQHPETGAWLKGDNPRSRFYNHSTFGDLVISGLVGLRPRAGDMVQVNPLVPADTWPWFCLDGVPYHGRSLTILWDKDGTRYGKGKGLSVFADGDPIARSETLTRVEGRLDAPPRPALLPAKPLGKVVPADELKRVYERVKTPFKYGVVLRGEDKKMVDCPCVFRGPGTEASRKWYMVYICMNEVGYETHLAESADLLEWKPLGKVLPFAQSDDAWDRWQAAGGLALIDHRWENGTHAPQTFDGKYWMTYIGGSRQGYETDPLSLGVAWTTLPPTDAKPWTRNPDNPVLTPHQTDAREFEQKTLYKSTVIRDDAESLGFPFVMFYNAKVKNGYERIGIAVSKDMLHWTRYGDGPVVANGEDKRNGMNGDPQIVKIGDVWVMFYFGAGWAPKAFDTFAASYDLVHWTKWDGPHLIEPSEPWDATYAHKPWVVNHDGVVYHFYCTVGSEGRVIALATSKNLRRN